MKSYYFLFLITFFLLWVEGKCEPKNKITKQGLCPKPTALKNGTAPCDSKCSNDSDCSGPLRCCDTGCGLQCVSGVRKGFCPQNDLPVDDKTGHEEKPRPKCFSDFDCKKPAKCCDRGSSKDCLPARKDKPGKCPNAHDPKPKTSCSSDYDCPDSQKCCSKLCEIPEKATYAVPLS